MENQVNIPTLRFTEFYGEWEMKNGNEVFNTISDKNHNSDLPILAITQEFGAVPRDMINYQISVTEKSVDSYKIVRKGDFIISLRSFQGGIEYSEYEGICSPAYIILKSKIEIIDQFFKYYLKTDRYIVELNRKLEGIRDGKMISYSYFSDIKLPYPSLPEQEKIASFLTDVDDKLQALKKKKSLLDQYKKGVMQKIFSKELRFKDDDGNEFLEWEVKKLGEIGETKRGLASNDLNYIVSGGIRLIRINDFFENNPVFILETEKTKRCLITKDDIMFAGTGASAGSCFLPTKEMINLPHSYNAPRIRVSSMTNKIFLINVLKSSIILKQQEKMFVGAAQQFLDISAINSFEIPLPCLEEQTKIANFLSAIDEKIHLVQGQIDKMEVWKKGLLQKMFV